MFTEYMQSHEMAAAMGKSVYLVALTIRKWVNIATTDVENLPGRFMEIHTRTNSRSNIRSASRGLKPTEP
jgi:hypothetical protein